MIDKTEEHGLLRDMVAKYLAANYDFERRRAILASDAGWSREAWRAFADLGLIAAAIPADQGGIAEGPEEALIVMEEFGRRLVVEPYLETALVAASLIAGLGTSAQRAALLPPIVAGETIWAFAHAEGRAGANPHDVATVAVAVEGGYRLTGRKAVVAAAGWADHLLVSALADEGPEAGRPSLFIVEPGSEGVTLEAYRTLDGRGAAEVDLDHVFVPAEALLGTAGQADAAIEAAEARAVAAQCAEALGIMATLNAATLDFAKVREQFGQPIGRFQALQHRLVDMYIAETEARGIAGTLPALLAGANRNGSQTSAAKVKISEAGRLIAEEAIQIHGGMGMTDELSIGAYAKRIIAITLQHGNERDHLDRFVALELAGELA